MKIMILMTLLIGSQALAQKTPRRKPTNAAAPAATAPAPAKPDTESAGKPPPMILFGSSGKSYIYASAVYSSYSDEVLATATDGSAGKTRTLFQAFGASADWAYQSGRILFGASFQVLKGQVDFEQKVGILPRSGFMAYQAGAEVGYRFSQDIDAGASIVALQRNISDVGTSSAFGNFAILRLRLKPGLALTQSLGNYASATTSAYAIGLRWLIW